MHAPIAGTPLDREAAQHRYTVDEVLDTVDALLGLIAERHGETPARVHGHLDARHVVRTPDGGVAIVDPDPGQSATFGYAAPEQLLGDATAASDLYAIGALSAGLLCRREPREMATKDARLEWRSHAVVPPAVADWIDAMVQRDPERRPISASNARERLAVARAGGAPTRVAVMPAEDHDPKHLASGQIPLVTAWIALHLVPAALLIGGFGVVLMIVIVLAALLR